jgi:hypothetical protein
LATTRPSTLDRERKSSAILVFMRPMAAAVVIGSLNIPFNLENGSLLVISTLSRS